jgi:cytochrome c-type biogenesis protein CcmE
MSAPRTGVRLTVVGLAAVAALGVLGASGLRDSLVYYRTPSELAAGPAQDGERLRLGGLVVAGSVKAQVDGVRFVLTDGAADVEVLHRGDPPAVFQEGQGALVEGTVGPDGVFRSDFLVVKHSNEYQGPGSDLDAVAEGAP